MNYYEHHLGDYDGATAHLSWMEDARTGAGGDGGMSAASFIAPAAGAEFVDRSLSESDDERRTRSFVSGCIERGLCPLCIASGARGACALDLLGCCSQCGEEWAA